MKLKRLGAFFLAIVMVMGLVVTSASAASFTDISGHWSESYVEDVYAQGMVSGYSDGSFGPDNQMTYCEALLFCSRLLGLSVGDKAQVYLDYSSTMASILPDTVVSWAATEMSYCVAAGVISLSELEAVSNAGNLTSTISRETLAMYLTRAMQLGSLADNLVSYSLNFNDTASISSSMRPYVYVLNSYGIIQGDENNNFNPSSSLTRAEMATMLSRASEFMTSRGIITELADYSSALWAGGYITSVSTSSGVSVVVLTSDFSGARSFSIPATAKIYEYNMVTSSSSLQTGEYLRVCYNSSGTVTSARIGGSTTTYTGDITSLTEDEVTIYGADGIYHTFDIDYFTEVKAGMTVGDYSLIDLAAGYVEATCVEDDMGHLASVYLSGGTNSVEGIIYDVTYNTSGNQVIQLSSMNGSSTTYTIASTASITNTSGTALSLSSLYEDDYATMRTSDTTGEVESLIIDTSSTYVQGVVKYYSTYNETVSIGNLETGSYTTYYLSDYALLYYEDELFSDMSDMEKGWYITATIVDSEVTALRMYDGDYEVDGTISSISYGVTTVIDVILTDGSSMTFNIDMTDIPTIYRSDSYSSIDKLKTGDEVEITVSDCEISYIYAYPQDANVSGTISTISMDSSGGAVIELLIGTYTQSYTISSGVSVTWDDDTLSVTDLKPNYVIDMVVLNDQVVSIEIDDTAVSNKTLSGTVIYTDTSAGTILLSLSDSSTITTVYTSSASFYYADYGTTIYLSYLDPGDYVQVYGYYSGSSFIATLVVLV